MGRRPQWILATTLLASCTYPRTEIDVRVDTDLAWGTGAAMQSLRIELRVGSAAGEVVSQRSVTFGRGGDRVLLPVTFAMSPRDQDATQRVWIQVQGCHDPNGCDDGVHGAPLVTQRALVSYVRRETRRLDVFLASICQGVTCPEAQTCDDATGRCVDATVPETRLTPVMTAPVPRSCQGAARGPGCELVAVPAATFAMGRDAVGCGDDAGVDPDTCVYLAQPAQRQISVSAFYLDRDLVTVRRFRAFWLAGHPAPTDPVRYPGGTLTVDGMVNTEAELTANARCNWNVAGYDQHPMNCADWTTAQAFCVWDGGRLPTEAEWELAARGVEGRTYPWGSQPADATRVCAASRETSAGTCEVASLLAGQSPLGLQDLSGNVFQWTADWFVPYSDAGCWGGAARVDPLCRVMSTSRSLRGGGWSTPGVVYQRGASRYSLPPSVRDANLGFRCARSPAP